ncbi:MAG: DUF2075 domain-containing protein [Planctomycetes bacterium]|nr:DUF2075 domain-containing protein [Planctomycetota bacterium]
MQRAYYSNTIENFLNEDVNTVLGQLVQHSEWAVEQSQRDAWIAQIHHLKPILATYGGSIYFEYAIPRMGKRVDVVLVVGAAIYVLEYKFGECQFAPYNIDQVVDYALDLKNFHESSHDLFIVPIFIATEAPNVPIELALTPHQDNLFAPIKSNGDSLGEIIRSVYQYIGDKPAIDASSWEKGRYCPTPTIIEAAMALYNGHAVSEISRSDAGGAELHRTTQTIATLIADARARSYKAVCFVTGVPGAGKTLIGLNVATQHFDKDQGMCSVFLSGNGPLVKILQEALARDKVSREKIAGRVVKKHVARSQVKVFIQNVHHYRDECLRDPNPPVDHVALFDEAQRAWNVEQTSKFMQQKKGQANFNQSEPEFLLSCIDRHPDWGVVICLVGGGQEINTGEAGISEWVSALNRRFPDWRVHISDRLTDAEFGAGQVLKELNSREHVHYNSRLHLSVSMRSFRAEHVSLLVKQALDLDQAGAKETLLRIADRYPIVLTRDLNRAKVWLRNQARGSERYGILASSAAYRLKPLAIEVRLKPDHVHWFLSGKEDVRSSYYLEDVSREFDIQGLELDWACVVWDADFRYSTSGWSHHAFRADRWQRIKKLGRKLFQKNAYRVLLTRARQGMVIVIPPGETGDSTRNPSFYDPTFEYLKDIGVDVLD